jgi:hypothetical protein
MIDAKLLQALRSLVGRDIEFKGHACRVIEILPSEKVMVIRCEDGQRVIQGNQFGEANRRVQQCHSVPLFDDGETLNPVIRRWLG